MNELDTYMNKSGIRQRMHRFAANYLGAYQPEMLDPVVSLFIESLGEEIYKVAGEIDNLENRLLDKLSSILVPDIETIAKPAHTVLHVTPAESKVEITAETEFQCSGFSFYPVCDTLIYKGDIRYFIYNGLLASVNADQTKTVITANGKKEHSSENSFWIGLELDSSIENISGLSFYIDFQTLSPKNKYLNLIPYFEWKIGNRPVLMEKGLFSVREDPENDLLELYSACDFSRKINASVKESYDKHFFTIKNDCNIKDKKELLPEALKSCFSPTVTGNFTQALLWIEINRPPGFVPEIIQTLQIGVNAFPVINKKLVSKTIDINRIVPLVPLNTGRNESFISVHSLSDSNGKRYYEVPVPTDTENTEYGVYSLRRGGCERYNARDATEYLSELIYSLSGEASAFFKNQNDVKNDLKKIGEKVNELVKQLNQVISKTKDRYEVENYILVSQTEPENIFFVKYWITRYMGTNQIHPGMRFNPPYEIPIQSVVALTSSKGEKQAPLVTEKSNLYKQSLSKHCLLITNKDIEDFCRENFRDFFTEIKISKGLVETPGIGFELTTDVYLKSIKESEKRDGAYFERILREKSPATCKYRVFIVN